MSGKKHKMCDVQCAERTLPGAATNTRRGEKVTATEVRNEVAELNNNPRNND